MVLEHRIHRPLSRRGDDCRPGSARRGSHPPSPTLRDAQKRLKEAEYDMANASFKSASARQEWMSDFGNSILWALVVGIPLFTFVYLA